MTMAVFKKISLFGLSQNKVEILAQLQNLGCLHLIAINPKQAKSLIATSTTLIEQMKKALRYLNDTPQKAHPKKIVKDFNADKILSEVNQNHEQMRKNLDRRDFLQERIEDLSVWGHFDLPNKDEIDEIKLWFYKIKIKDINKLDTNLIVQEVYRNHLFIYLIVLSKDEPKPTALPSPRIHTGATSLNHLKQELMEINEKIDDLEEERRRLSRYNILLANEIARFTDASNLQQAEKMIDDKKEFFMAQAWVPENQLSDVKQFCHQYHLAVIAESPTTLELPPTLMQTHPWVSGGTALANFYQTPGYHAVDPSLMLFFSFSIFFAIILADAGYGLIIALFTLFSWKWLGKFNAGTWLRPLLITISIFSIIYGVMLGSYFGVEPSEHSFLDKFKILNIHDFPAMMKFVIAIGCIHIMIANALHAWFETNLYAKIHSIGFIGLILGFMVLAWGMLNHIETSKYLSIAIIIISLLIVIIFASDIPITNFKSFLMRSLHGLESLSKLTSLFGDILSYMRLFALGLAGASLAMTFNHIAVQVAHNTLNGHGWILAILILLIGQTLNFGLCIMSGLIHGLRLNYIEFFKWSIKEDGYPYTPLKKIGDQS